MLTFTKMIQVNDFNNNLYYNVYIKNDKYPM